MGKSIIGTTTSNFEYIISDIPEKLGRIEENILDFETQFQSGEFTQGELNMIARNLESTAVYFGQQQGLGGSNLLIIGPDNLQAKADKNKIEFVNKTQDNYGRYYAGFVEYGHYSKERFISPRPFMRPALYAVSKASAGQIADVLGDLMSTIFRESGGYQGVHKLNFGHYYGRARSGNLVSSKLGELQGSKFTMSEFNAQSGLNRRNFKTFEQKSMTKAFSRLNKTAILPRTKGKSSEKKSNKKNSKKSSSSRKKSNSKKTKNAQRNKASDYLKSRRQGAFSQKKQTNKKSSSKGKRKKKAQKSKKQTYEAYRDKSGNIVFTLNGKPVSADNVPYRIWNKYMNRR